MGYFSKYGGANNGRFPSPIVFNKNRAAGLDGYEEVVSAAGGFEDFLCGVPAAAAGETLITGIGQWIFNKKTGGTIVDAAADGGAIALTPASTEDQGCQVQSMINIAPAAGRTIILGARVKIYDPTQVDAFVGLQIAQTNLALPASYVGFKIADGSAIIYATNNKATVSESNSTGVTAVANTYNRLELVINGLDSIDYYVDGVLRYTTTVVAKIPTAAMAYTLTCENGTGATQNMTVDWIY